MLVYLISILIIDSVKLSLISFQEIIKFKAHIDLHLFLNIKFNRKLNEKILEKYFILK